MKLQVPGKTFLVGEYAVLLDGPALGLATKPCFEISYGNSDSLLLHPDSPAGRYRKKHPAHFEISMTNPYPGGFGKSTAEYLAVIAPELRNSQKDFHEILKEYKTLSPGSGIDLAFQFFGQVCLADPALQFYQTFDWHFANLDFLIVSTGLKIPTHEHLRTLDLKYLKDLPALSDKVITAYSRNQEVEFLELMKLWSRALKNLELTHQNSIEIISALETCSEVKLAKACGALGADVIIVFFDRQNAKPVIQTIAKIGLKIQAGSSDLCEGTDSQLQKYRRQNVD